MRRGFVTAAARAVLQSAQRLAGSVRPSRLRYRLAQALVQRVTVTDDRFAYTFVCSSPVEVSRARTLLTKEVGTVRWLESQVREGDVFYDIGANIGLYSVFAARRLHGRGRVYAFEPHLENAVSLLRNIQANGLDDLVTVVSSALHDHGGHLEFNYHSLEPGSSRSQLTHNVLPLGQVFEPVARELKAAVALDDLVGAGVIERPDLVKIDVDGNEPWILKGMRTLLSDPAGPRSLQVEVQTDGGQEVLRFLDELGFEEVERHYTASGERRVGLGFDAGQIAYNGVFLRKER